LIDVDLMIEFLSVLMLVTWCWRL